MLYASLYLLFQCPYIPYKILYPLLGLISLVAHIIPIAPHIIPVSILFFHSLFHLLLHYWGIVSNPTPQPLIPTLIGIIIGILILRPFKGGGLLVMGLHQSLYIRIWAQISKILWQFSDLGEISSWIPRSRRLRARSSSSCHTQV